MVKLYLEIMSYILMGKLAYIQQKIDISPVAMSINFEFVHEKRSCDFRLFSCHYILHSNSLERQLNFTCTKKHLAI